MLFSCSISVHLDSTCGTNGVKKSSDETAGSQSLFMNNTEHSFSANSLVRKTEISLFKNKKEETADYLNKNTQIIVILAYYLNAMFIVCIEFILVLLVL